MTLAQMIANDVAVAIDAAGGRVPSAIQMHSKLEKVLRSELNGLREKVGQEPVPENDSLFVMGVRVVACDSCESVLPWTIVQ